jgi:WD40-like Beta Propeller Repeat
VRLGGALAIGVLAAMLAPAAHGARAPRILYAGDWTGPMQIFAADPSGRAPLGQVTFARPAGPCLWAAACGYTRPLPSPDGRWLAYWTGGVSYTPATLLLARADGTGARPIGVADGAAWAPDSRRLAYSASDGIHVLTTAGVDRIVNPRGGGLLHWSPDGRTLAFVARGAIVLRHRGRERVLVPVTPSSLAWSPDGRRIAYSTQEGVSLVSTVSGRARLVYRVERTQPFPSTPLELSFSPDGRFLAFAFGAEIRILTVATMHARTLRVQGHDLGWSPDGRRLLYVQGGESSNGDAIDTGDVQTVTPSGRVRTVVRAAGPYGGQIVAAAWTTPARGVRYRAPQPVDGVFAGGPVQELAADGGRAAFVACGGVSAWNTATGAVDSVESPGECRATYSRGHVYSLGLAGDHVAWLEKGWGLCFSWTAREATLGSSPFDLGTGYGCLGEPPPDGVGTTVGSGSLLVMSAWRLHFADGATLVDQQTVERVEPGGCPCPALSSSPGPYTPLDVDAGRIVVSGRNETRILAADGTILLSLSVPTLAAQLSGDDLVLAAGSELRVYDAVTGSLRATWPLPAQPVGHDCDLFGDPSCFPTARLTLGGVARGLAAYAFDGQVHLLRLVDGADRIVAPGTLPRFFDAGLVYADGARVRLVPYPSLPLH